MGGDPSHLTKSWEPIPPSTRLHSSWIFGTNTSAKGFPTSAWWTKHHPRDANNGGIGPPRCWWGWLRLWTKKSLKSLVIKGVVWCTRKVERFKKFYQTSSCLATMRMEKSSQKYALKWWWKMVMNPRVESSPQEQIQTIFYGFGVQGFQGQNPIIKVWFTNFFQPKKKP